MNWNKKAPAIKFISTIPGVSDFAPIYPASRYVYPWAKKAAESYKEGIKACPFEKHSTIQRCPGINKIKSMGWILPSWQDINITTDGAGVDFTYTTPLDQNDLNNESNVSFHKKELYSDFRDTWPVDTLKTVIKINTGWRVEVPKGYVLLQVPVPYMDTDIFTPLEGAYTYEYGPASINVPMYWHKHSGTHTIKAGTPLVKLILVSEPEALVEVVEDLEYRPGILANLVYSREFIRTYKSIKKFFTHNTKDEIPL